MKDFLKGVFPALPTPFFEDLTVDYASLESVVDFAISAGAHGLTALDMPGEFFTLTDEERRRCVETIIKAAKGRVPVIVNVSAASQEQSFLFARHAKESGASALMSTPPFFRAQSAARIRTYFQLLNEASDLPIILQNSPDHMGCAISADMQAELVRSNRHVQYVMEECVAEQQVISDVLACLDGVEHFSCVAVGSCCSLMLHDYSRGARLFIPQAEMTDLFVALWDALEQNDSNEAMARYALIAPLLMFGSSYQRSFSKGLLRRRGVIATTAMRESSKPVLDDIQQKELDEWAVRLKPEFRV